MSKEELWRLAIGEKNTDYYVKSFLHIENGSPWRAMWNWGAFFTGPLWMIYRRFPVYELCIRGYLSTLGFMYASNGVESPFNIVAVAAVYCLFFPVTANVIYFYRIRKLIAKNSNSSVDEIKILLQKNFRTEFEVIRERTKWPF